MCHRKQLYLQTEKSCHKTTDGDLVIKFYSQMTVLLLGKIIQQ